MSMLAMIAGSVFSWPAVAALVAILYRRPIGDAVRRLRQFKCGNYFEGRLDPDDGLEPISAPPAP